MLQARRSNDRRKRRRSAETDALGFAHISAPEFPMTAYEIVRASGGTGDRLLPLQVYRSLERLMRNRQIERIATIGTFVPGAGSKPLHFLCTECGVQPVRWMTETGS